MWQCQKVLRLVLVFCCLIEVHSISLGSKEKSWTRTFVVSPSFALKHRELRSSNGELLAIIPFSIVDYSFTVLLDNLSRNSCFSLTSSKLSTCVKLKNIIIIIVFVCGWSMSTVSAYWKYLLVDQRFCQLTVSNCCCDIIFAGSNSVNVFLGLGLPWVISTCYHAVRKTKYIVYSGNLTFSVVVFTAFGLICIFTLIARRLVSFFLTSLLCSCWEVVWLYGYF